MPKSKEILSSNDDLSEEERVTKKRKSDDKKPKSKKPESENESEDGSVDEKPKKKAKVEKSKAKKKQAKSESEEEDSDQENDGMYKLANMRFVNVSEFKGKAYVNIREYYEKDGKQLPGKKGISLNSDQWENLKKYMTNIDKDMKKFK